jgi:hypothetical protein
MKALLENPDAPLVFGTLLCCTLFFFAAWFCYYYNNIKLPCFLILMIFPSISTAISFNFSFISLSDEGLVFLVVEYLVLFSLICYKKQKKSSFFFLYLASYSLNLYCVYRVSISPILTAYVFSSSVFFLYHWYFTFTRRFILRSYSVVKAFISSYSVVKLVLWLLFVLFPVLVNNHFSFFLIFNRLFLQALLSNHTTISFFLTILGLWYIFLSISSHFKMFSKVRRKVLNYFSRRACLHFVGNGFGSRLGLKVGAHIAATAVVCVPVCVSSALVAVESANMGGLSAVTACIENNPGASRAETKAAFVSAYNIRISTNPVASTLQDMSGGRALAANYDYFDKPEVAVKGDGGSALFGGNSKKPLKLYSISNDFDIARGEDNFVFGVLNKLKELRRFDPLNNGRVLNGSALTVEAQMMYLKNYPNGKVVFFFNETTLNFYTNTLRSV